MRRLAGTVTAATIAAGLVSLAPTAQGAPQQSAADTTSSTVFRDNGRPLAGSSGQAPGQVVRDYLQAHGVSKAAAGSLHAAGAAWKTRGTSHLRMTQTVAGLRVYGTGAKAAFDADGRLVDLIENVVDVNGAPAKAAVSPADALVAAAASLYPHRSVSTDVTGRSGNTVTFAKGSFYSGPTVETVAVPMQDGSLAEGYAVSTWNATSNDLYETLVDGAGNVLGSELRTAEDGYNIFPEDPAKTSQTMATDPADATASPFGWLDKGTQHTTDISGNNAHAYLDANDDNRPDPATEPVTDGVFGSVFDRDIQPDEGVNRAVATQNLFYLNNLIHDTLFKAGFDEAAGNFQDRNTDPVGNAGDAVNAEGQDGGGTDNANFATPVDGKAPRMQMYLWSVPGMYEVSVPDTDAGTTDATNATWGTPLTKDGVTGTLSLANDGSGTTTDACETLLGDHTGEIVIADRGSCNFTVKAKNAQNAGAKGIIVAALASSPSPITMGGSDSSVTITGVMVSYSDGVKLKGAVDHQATLKLTEPAPIMKDGDLDSDIVWHEYGHGLTWRMIDHMSGPMSGAIGEGMSDVLSVVVNDDPVVGEYSASDPGGIRTHSYEGYDRTYGSLNSTQEANEVHLDGEVYGAIGWDLWKRYEAAGLSRDALLADLVDGMNYTQPHPAFEDMRDGILAGLANSGHLERAGMVWQAFAKYGVGVGARGKVLGGPVTGPFATGKTMEVHESFMVPEGVSAP